jgi:sugar O-acyltransferase (sialic acid O-acetyltransferase NeuD family)
MKSSEAPMKPVVIFGGGDQGRVAYVYLSKDSPYEVVAFTAHEACIDKGKLLGLDVVPFERIEEIYPPERFAMYVAIAFARVNKTRAELYYDCKRKGYELVSYISSKAIQWGEIEVGDNCFILESTVIHPFVTIGHDVSIGSGCIIGHDVSIGDHCFVASGAVISGRVEIGPYCFIGANATFRNGITIAPECIIGAGTLILEDTKERGVYLAKGTEAASTTSDVLSPFFGTRPSRRQ